ncbi:MAG: hypothetical protein ABIO24_02800, partial [Saprospiraceae bacterium]
GSDQTMMVCDGNETFYSTDAHSYYKGNAKATPQCELSLSKFYEMGSMPAPISFVGRDLVRLAEADHTCIEVRSNWKERTVRVIRTLCIDLVRPLILRDVIEREDEKTGVRSVKTTMLIDFESNPVFPPDAFRFLIPQGAVEAKPPI